MSHFTHYWKNDTCDHFQRSEGALIIMNTRTEGFLRYGVQVGDFVYSMTVRKGLLYLIGYIEVGKIVKNRLTAAAELCISPDVLWRGSEYVIVRRATPHRFNRIVQPSLARQLRFITSKGTEPLKYRDLNQTILDPQTLRIVRKMTVDSAQLIEDLTEPLKVVEKGDIEIWEKRLPSEGPD